MGDRRPGPARVAALVASRVLQVDREEPRRGVSKVRRTPRQRRPRSSPGRSRKMLDQRPPGHTERAGNQGTVLRDMGLGAFLTDKNPQHYRASARQKGPHLRGKAYLDIYLIYQICVSVIGRIRKGDPQWA